jgi:PhzF family phenazine biosynthesis protein
MPERRPPAISWRSATSGWPPRRNKLLTLHLIDAFAEGPFTGNPAAVVRLKHAVPEAWMQRVAREMNQAETAFLLRQARGFSLRWFTPAAEVDLCGHATLASAHYLWESGELDTGMTAEFETRSGWLRAERGGDGQITIDLPAIHSRAVAGPADASAALGVKPLEILQGDFDLLFVLANGAAVRTLRPDLAALGHWDARGVIVTAAGDAPGIDFVSRFFVPNLGIPEDPVTGSAHCALAPYWQQRLQRHRLVGYQASARGGTVYCEVVGERVKLTGRAVTTVRGELLA